MTWTWTVQGQTRAHETLSQKEKGGRKGGYQRGKEERRKEGRREKEGGKKEEGTKKEKESYFKKSLENLARPCLPVKNLNRSGGAREMAQCLNVLDDQVLGLVFSTTLWRRVCL